MNQFQKNVIFIAIVFGGLGLAGFGINGCVQEHAQYLVAQHIEWRKENIKVLKDLSAIGALSTEEQTRVDNAGDDYDRLQQVLLDIHQERISYWEGRVSDTEEEELKFARIVAEGGYGGYDYGPLATKISHKMSESRRNLSAFQTTKQEIRDWKPVSFKDYETGKSKIPSESAEVTTRR